ncbi:MAG: VanZ family protein [Rhodoferax sp.]|nr:VanZ family protein [Rhodoferax sp.]
MIFNKHLARGLLAAMVLLLLVGTLIPGAWRNALEASLQAPIPLAKLAHLLIFIAMAFVVRVSDLSWSVPMVLLAALGLGLLTEGLQLVAIGRDANWRDVGIDVLGASLGLVFAQAVRKHQNV